MPSRTAVASAKSATSHQSFFTEISIPTFRNASKSHPRNKPRTKSNRACASLRREPMLILLALLLVFAACEAPKDRSADRPESHLKPSAPPPGERHPLREGFTQRPPRDTPGLPPPAIPLFTEAELHELEAR